MLLGHFPHFCLLAFAAGFYALACLYGVRIFFVRTPYSQRLLSTLVIVGFCLQTLGLFFYTLKMRALSLSFLPDWLNCLAWFLMALSLFIQLFNRVRLLNLFAAGLASLFIFWALFFYESMTPIAVETYTSHLSPWIEWHAALAFLAYGAFGLLALVSVFYLVQDYGLSHKRYGLIFSRMPALGQILLIDQKILFLGLTLLCGSIVLGAIGFVLGEAEFAVPKIGFSLGLLAGYIYLHRMRKAYNCRMRLYAWLGIAFFCLCLLSLGLLG